MSTDATLWQRIEDENLDVERRASFEYGFRWWLGGHAHKRHIGQGDTLAEAFANLDARADEASTCSTATQKETAR